MFLTALLFLKSLSKNFLSRWLRTFFQFQVFQCNLCSKVYTLKTNLTRHIHQKHSGADDKSYECSTCGKKFNRGDNLKQHLKSHKVKDVVHCFSYHASFLILVQLSQCNLVYCRNHLVNRNTSMNATTAGNASLNNLI